MNKTNFLNLVALCLSDGGVGFSSETMYIHFTNNSQVLLEMFKNEVRKFSQNKIHKQIKPRGITLRVFDKNLVDQLLKISPSYRTRACNHFPFCPFIKEGDLKYKIGEHDHFESNDSKYAEIIIPEEIFQTSADKSRFLRIYASCDGYPSIFPRSNSWSAVERIVAIVCHHPSLKQRLHELLDDLNVNHTVKPNSLEMRSQEAITQFNKKIGFIRGVKMTGNSKYWEGIEKNEILRKIIESYSMKFDSRDPKIILSKLNDI